jgi:hypothetical protein
VVSNPDADHIGGFLDVFDALGHRPRSATHGSGAWATGCFGTHASASAPPASSLLPPAYICENPRPPLEAHALVEHLCLTERGTQCGALSQWYLGSDHLEAPVPVTAHRGKA